MDPKMQMLQALAGGAGQPAMLQQQGMMQLLQGLAASPQPGAKPLMAPTVLGPSGPMAAASNPLTARIRGMHGGA